MAGLKIFRMPQIFESPGRLGKVDARFVTTGNHGLINLTPPPTIAVPLTSGDALRIFPDPDILSTNLVRPTVKSPTLAERFSQTARAFARAVVPSALVPMLHSGTDVAVNGGLAVFTPTQEISVIPDSTRMAGLGSPDFGAFLVVMSAAVLIVAIVRRAREGVAPVMAMATPPGVPRSNERYTVPDGITVSNIPPTGRSHSQGSMTMRPITQHNLVMVVTDTAGPRPREWFSLIREGDGLAPLLIPIEMVRRAVLQGEIAQTPFRAPHEMPSIPFRDPVTKQTFHIFPSWNLNPKLNASQPADPHAQIVGVVVKNDKSEVVLSLPWVDGWMTHSPMTYDPMRDSAHAWIVPKGWTGEYMTVSQRTEASAALLERLPQMTYLTPEQQEAMAMVATAVASPRMDSGIARWAVNAVMQGRRSTVYMADQVADVVRGFPIEWITDRPLDVGLDAEVILTPQFTRALEECVARTHDVFPALSDGPYLFPPPGGVRPYVPRKRAPQPVVVVRPQAKK